MVTQALGETPGRLNGRAGGRKGRRPCGPRGASLARAEASPPPPNGLGRACRIYGRVGGPGRASAIYAWWGALTPALDASRKRPKLQY
jgi:hypothetical protein